MALLLLTMLQQNAAAAAEPDKNEHQSKNARKVLILLGSLGINDPDIKNLISKADGRIKGGYLTLAEERVAGGTLKLHYQTGTNIGIKRMEIQFTPDNSDWRAFARTDRVMIEYKYKF